MIRPARPGVRQGLVRVAWVGVMLLAPALPSWAGETEALFAATLADPGGKSLALSRWKGQPLVVNFWARWCGPCKKEIPDLVALQKAHKGVAVLGISIEDASAAEHVAAFARAYEINYAVILAGSQGLDLMRSLGNDKAGLPFTVAIDGQGRIVARKLGLMARPEMEAAFRKAAE